MIPLGREPPYVNLENLQEETVLRLLPKIVEAEQNKGRAFCACPACLVDIAAVALNALPTRYVADRYNSFGITESEQARMREEATRAIQLAIHRVGSRPHHV